jgi:hypothetical protein
MFELPASVKRRVVLAAGVTEGMPGLQEATSSHESVVAVDPFALVMVKVLDASTPV